MSVAGFIITTNNDNIMNNNNNNNNNNNDTISSSSNEGSTFSQSDEVLLNSLGISSTSTYIDSNDIINALNAIKVQNNIKDKVLISYRLLLWANTCTDIEKVILPCFNTLLDIIQYIIIEANDAVELFSKVGYIYGNQMAARYLGQLLFKVTNQSTVTLQVTLAPLLLNCLSNIFNQQVELKERAPFEADDAPIVRLDAVKLLLQSLPTAATKNDDVDIAIIGFLLVTVGKSYYAKSIRDLAKDIVSNIGYTCANLFVNHVESFIFALQYSSELGFILKSCPELFESSYEIFEKHSVYLLQTFSFVGLEAAIKDIALYEPLRLTMLIPGLINQIPTSYLAGDILLVLLRIAIVDATGFKDQIQKLYDNCALNPTLCKTPFFALLAVCSKVGVQEVVMIFNMFQKIIVHDIVSNMHLADQCSLIGALDVITDKLSQEVKLSSESIASLTKISKANPRAFENLMRWQKNKWARKGNLDYFVKQLNIVPVPKKVKKQVLGRRQGLSYFGNKNFLQRSKHSMLDAERREVVIIKSDENGNTDANSTSETATTKHRFSFFSAREKEESKEKKEGTNATRRKGKFNFSFVNKNSAENVNTNVVPPIVTQTPATQYTTMTPATQYTAPNDLLYAYNSTLTPIVPQPTVQPTPPPNRPSFINRMRNNF